MTLPGFRPTHPADTFHPRLGGGHFSTKGERLERESGGSHRVMSRVGARSRPVLIMKNMEPVDANLSAAGSIKRHNPLIVRTEVKGYPRNKTGSGSNARSRHTVASVTIRAAHKCFERIRASRRLERGGVPQQPKVGRLPLPSRRRLEPARAVSSILFSGCDCQRRVSELQ